MYRKFLREHNKRLYHRHLVCTPELVHFPMNVILTRRQIEGRHPLVGILPALSGYLSDFHWSTKVTLEPLQVIVVTGAPGPHEATVLDLAQSPESGRVKMIPFG